MDPRRKRRIGVLAKKIHSPVKKKPKKEVGIRSKKILALLPPVNSEGSSSSSDEEEVSAILVSTGNEEENVQLEVDYIDDNMQATLADVIVDIPVTTEFMDQQEIMLMTDPHGPDFLDTTFVDGIVKTSATTPQSEHDDVLGPSSSSYPGDHSYAIENTYYGDNDASSHDSVDVNKQNGQIVVVQMVLPSNDPSETVFDVPSCSNNIQTLSNLKLPQKKQNELGKNTNQLVVNEKIIQSDVQMPLLGNVVCKNVPDNGTSSNNTAALPNLKNTQKKRKKVPKVQVHSKKKAKTNREKQKKKLDPVNFEWEKKTPFLGVVTETTIERSLVPPSLKETGSPNDYFSRMFSDDIWLLIVEQTNLYSCQITGTPLNVTVSEIKGFVGILLLMGIVDMPSYTDYWSNDLRFETIASTMPLKRFQAIRKYIHFSNNDLTENQSDRYFKIRPLLELVRKNFLSIKEEGSYSIDEMMVPYKGKKAGNRRQYVKKKPKKWGFKIFVRAGVSGMIYDFTVYGGESTFIGHTFSETEELMGVGAKVVISLCKSIHSPTCSFVFFDKFFCSLELIILLREKYGILSLGTIRTDRLRQCPLLPDKVLKVNGRGSYDMAVDNKHKVCVVKWEDNKCVCLASTYCEAEPVGKIKRFPKKKKSKTTRREPLSKMDVTCPNIVKQYNSFMGGVDLADMLVALYRTGFRTHRWYLSIFSQILDMCISNAWLLYRREHQVCGVGKQVPLKHFRLRIAELLIKTGKRYSPSPRQQKVVELKLPRKAPVEELRFDGLEHYPQMATKGRCAYCKNGQTKMECMKCKSRLCLTQEKNCFYQFHQKQ